MPGGGGELRTNLAEAESHRVGVVILRDEDAKDKVSQLITQPVGHQHQHAEGGNQRVQGEEEQVCLHVSELHNKAHVGSEDADPRSVD